MLLKLVAFKPALLERHGGAGDSGVGTIWKDHVSVSGGIGSF